jgi:hypothetical protein
MQKNVPDSVPVGKDDFFFFLLSFELIFYIDILLYITADKQSKRPFGAIVALNQYNNCELVAAPSDQAAHG